MQATSLPMGTDRARRIVAVTLASAAAAAATFVVAANDSPVAIAPTPDSVSGGGTVSELSTVDGALLRHHGVKAARSTPISVGSLQPTAQQIQQAQQFNHFR